MSGFFWNVRGLNKSIKHSVIKKWLEEKQFDFGCLIETRVKEERVPEMVGTMFKNWSILTNYEHHRLGRIWIVWRNNVRLTPFYKSSQLIRCSIKLEAMKEEFFCSFVYASNLDEGRKELWRDLCDHHNSPIIGTKPWMILGDFNETLDVSEHSNFDSSPLITSGMRRFQDTVNHCSLTDMAYHGPLFTWNNKRGADLISKKLDRVLVNEVWNQDYPQAYSVFDAGGCSDHLRCRIQINTPALSSRRKLFKFVNAVTTLAEFLPMVKDFWANTEPIFLSTSSLHRLSKKLKNLKPQIRGLAKDRMGNLVKKSREAHEDLCKKQELNLCSPSSQHMEAENEAFTRWEFVAGLEESFLKKRSKLHWLNIGDQNNKTYHSAIAAREAVNGIREIRCRDGTLVNDENGIKEEAESFFREFL